MFLSPHDLITPPGFDGVFGLGHCCRETWQLEAGDVSLCERTGLSLRGSVSGLSLRCLFATEFVEDGGYALGSVVFPSFGHRFVLLRRDKCLLS